jgi:hypothetical protein
MGEHGRRDHNGIDTLIREDVVDPSRFRRARVPAPVTLQALSIAVADPGDLDAGHVKQGPEEARAPIAESHQAKSEWSFRLHPQSLPQTFAYVRRRESTS